MKKNNYSYSQSLTKSRDFCYSKYSPHNGRLYSHELLYEKNLQLHFSKLLSKYPKFNYIPSEKLQSAALELLSAALENTTFIEKIDNFQNVKNLRNNTNPNSEVFESY